MRSRPLRTDASDWLWDFPCIWDFRLFVTGSGLAVKLLTEDMKQLTGGQVIINGDAKESADILEKIIMEKRAGLNI